MKSMTVIEKIKEAKQVVIWVSLLQGYVTITKKAARDIRNKELAGEIEPNCMWIFSGDTLKVL